jgi:hypothetical protein
MLQLTFGRKAKYSDPKSNPESQWQLHSRLPTWQANGQNGHELPHHQYRVRLEYRYNDNVDLPAFFAKHAMDESQCCMVDSILIRH